MAITFKSFSAAILVGVLLATELVSCSPVVKRQADDKCTTPAVRRSWRALSNEAKLAYINGVKCLQNTPPQYGVEGARSVWDELQTAHIIGKNMVHTVGGFPFFHRAFVGCSERLLRHHCNYLEPTPYWDTPLDVGNMAASPVFDTTYGFGGNGRGPGNCVADGPFAGATLVMGLDGKRVEEYCLARSFNDDLFSWTAQPNVDQCLNEPNYLDFWHCLENWIHTGPHQAMGGTMKDALLSAGDPVFLLFHAHIDNIVWKWQQRGLPGRLSEIGGSNLPSPWYNALNGWQNPSREWMDSNGDHGTETTLNHVLYLGGVCRDVTIGEVINSEGPVMCARYE